MFFFKLVVSLDPGNPSFLWAKGQAKYIIEEKFFNCQQFHSHFWLAKNSKSAHNHTHGIWLNLRAVVAVIT